MIGKNLDELQHLRCSDARCHALFLVSAAIVWIASPRGEVVGRELGWEEYTGQPGTNVNTRVFRPFARMIRPQVTTDWMGPVGSGGLCIGRKGEPGSAPSTLEQQSDAI